MINITNLSEDFPLEVTQEVYDSLKLKKNQGWSHCDTDIEWLVKLHYLRTGFKEKKIAKDVFFKKEKELVLKWWKRWC
ncbi:MAG: hypothetical protein ACI86H_001514 [bacterium]|jgi:hypothetical protein